MSEVKPVSQKLPNYGTLTDEITIFAGPCSVESEEQFNEVAECIASLGLHWIRGGAFKPRTNPHSFQGLGEEALQIMKAGGDKYGLKTLTEVMDSEHCEMVHSYVDGLQVGARNFQNFSLLKNIGKVTKDSHKMVLFKRGFAGTIAEWLAATDYITMADETVDVTDGITLFDPVETWKKRTFTNVRAERLNRPIYVNGKRVYENPPLRDIRDFCAAQVATLWDEVTRFENPHRYYVDLSQKLWDERQRLLTEFGR